MTVRSRQQHDREAPGRILDAAPRTVRRRGDREGLDAEDREKIGYSPTTLYHHFADKDAMLDGDLRGRFPEPCGGGSRRSAGSPIRWRGSRTGAGLRRVRPQASQPLPAHVHDASSPRDEPRQREPAERQPRPGRLRLPPTRRWPRSSRPGSSVRNTATPTSWPRSCGAGSTEWLRCT